MENRAAYLLSRGARLAVQTAPFPTPSANEVIIRNHAVAINPVDVLAQDIEHLVNGYPLIPGLEVTGVVHEVGTAVTKFKPGDRVAALALRVQSKDNKHGAFQLYTTAPEVIVARLPENVPLESACVLPLCLATAAASLYSANYLALSPPSLSSTSVQEQGKAILIWGGSSVVGSCAIQLSVAAGMKVFTTASKKNFAYVKSLGAAEIFDRDDVDIVDKLVSGIDERNVVGALDAISVKETTEKTAEVLHRLGGGTLISTSDRAVKETVLLGDVKRIKLTPSSYEAGGGLPIWNKVWTNALENGLASGSIKPVPEPTILRGLESLQNALDLYREGVSAGKIVVAL